MSCFKPLHGFRSKTLTDSGKRPIVFRMEDGFADMRVVVPCGHCIGCRTDRARDWAVRCTHEAQMWRDNSFVTLTYDDAHLPLINGIPTLRPEDFVLFMKRLREWHRQEWLKGSRAVGEVYPGIKFLQAGEYGKYGRPHHHVLLFNCWFKDAKQYKKRKDFWLYRSAILESLWTNGFSSVGPFSPGSASYVTQYCLKKSNAEWQDDDIRVREYQTMSRGGRAGRGLGHSWLQRYGTGVYPSDMVVLRDGFISRPPRYYDNWLKSRAPRRLVLIKNWRRLKMRDEEHTDSRLSVRGECLEGKLRFFKESVI